MKEWFDGLETRERATLLLGAALLAVVVVLMAIVFPLYGKAADNAAKLASLQSDLVRVRELGAEIRAHGAAPGAGAAMQGANQSMLIIVSNTAREAGLSVRQTRPVNDTTVRVRFETSPFDDLVVWMGVVSSRYGMLIDNASFDRSATPGMVDAQFTLQRPGA